MGKMGRKVLAVVVALCMVMGLVAVPGGTQKVKAEVFGDFEYRVSGGTVEITKYMGTDTEVTVPEIIDRKNVSSSMPTAAPI